MRLSVNAWSCVDVMPGSLEGILQHSGLLYNETIAALCNLDKQVSYPIVARH